jgi:hypothetical protein
MRIAKQITYEYAKKLERFSLLKKKIDKHIKNNSESSIAKIENIKKLKYFLVIDCKDVYKELGFEEKNENSNFLFGTKEKNKKFIEHIRKKNSQPYYFKKLGLFYDISGCYLIATTKSEKSNISIYNNSSTISCKFELNDLPVDFKEMCLEYEDYSFGNEIKQLPNFPDIFNISHEEREKIIESIVSSFAYIKIPVQPIFPKFNDIYKNEQNLSRNNIQDIIESKINEIYDITFLEKVMESAIEDDNFELCAKIRDRIKDLKKNK